VLDQLRRPAVGETASKAIDQPGRTVRRRQQQGTGIRVILPPSNAPTTERPSTRANSNSAALHSVGIGTPLDPETNR
jgi:hypothetical protein